MSNNPDQAYSYPLEEDYDEEYDTDHDNSQGHYEEQEEYDEGGERPTIYCTICSQMVAPSRYTSHIQEHINVFREVSSSFQSVARLPHFHSLIDFPPLTSLTSFLSVPFTRATTPYFGQTNIRGDSPDSPDSPDIQGVSFSNAFVQISSPFVYTARFQLQYNPWLHDDTFDDYEANIRLADLIGKVEVGVRDIEQVSTKVLKDDNVVSDDTLCPICMENIKHNPDIESCRVLLCKHTYCDGCITRWLETSKHCPVCKVDLEEKAKATSTI